MIGGILGCIAEGGWPSPWATGSNVSGVDCKEEA